MSGRAVFLDRDGVLNQALVRAGRPYPPRRPEEFKLLPGVQNACAELRSAGYELIVVTNQPDIARGMLSADVLEQLNDALREAVEVDEIVVCPHDDSDDCPCRKPRPGMLISAAERRQLDLTESFMVGDRWRDIEAGQQAGCETVLIDRGYDERAVDTADCVVSDLSEAAAWILGKSATNKSYD